LNFKVVVQSISASGVASDTAALTSPMELAEAQRQLANLIEGRGARATPDGWMCQARDGTRYIVSLEHCQPESATGSSLVQVFHQPGAMA
jgi:hypothetical protein